MTRAGVVLLALVAAPAVARADADEASIHVQLVGGLATVGDAAAGDTTSSAPLAGLMARFGYATSDWYQYDASLTLAGTSP